jgi:signal transduction histidine kinase
VIGFSELLLSGDIPADIRGEVDIISKEAQRAARIVKDLLTFARKHTPAKQLSQINSIVEDVVRLRGYEERVNNIEVVRDLAPDLPEVTVDPYQMQQVFLNIVVNAEYFMAEAHKRGKLTITTKRIDGVIRISFADDGPGIAPGDVSRIFDPFFTTKPVGKGTGLGLSICHGIVSEHGGRTYATSELGKGATVVVDIPLDLPLTATDTGRELNQ